MSRIKKVPIVAKNPSQSGQLAIYHAPFKFVFWKQKLVTILLPHLLFLSYGLLPNFRASFHFFPSQDFFLPNEMPVVPHLMYKTVDGFRDICVVAANNDGVKLAWRFLALVDFDLISVSIEHDSAPFVTQCDLNLIAIGVKSQGPFGGSNLNALARYSFLQPILKVTGLVSACGWDGRDDGA